VWAFFSRSRKSPSLPFPVRLRRAAPFPVINRARVENSRAGPGERDRTIMSPSVLERPTDGLLEQPRSPLTLYTPPLARVAHTLTHATSGVCSPFWAFFCPFLRICGTSASPMRGRRCDRSLSVLTWSIAEADPLRSSPLIHAPDESSRLSE